MGALPPKSAGETARVEFHRFFLRHHREVARLAFLMLGDPDGADDLAADAMTAAWQRWDRVRAADQPLAYVRGMVVNMSRSRIRALVRERDKAARLSATAGDRVHGPPTTSRRTRASSSGTACPPHPSPRST
jgi:DNA-directed RNA polymerase specialized sigma24 family protein